MVITRLSKWFGIEIHCVSTGARGLGTKAIHINNDCTYMLSTFIPDDIKQHAPRLLCSDDNVQSNILRLTMQQATAQLYNLPNIKHNFGIKILRND